MKLKERALSKAIRTAFYNVSTVKRDKATTKAPPRIDAILRIGLYLSWFILVGTIFSIVMSKNTPVPCEYEPVPVCVWDQINQECEKYINE